MMEALWSKKVHDLIVALFATDVEEVGSNLSSHGDVKFFMISTI
jgi:aspartyl aminopeptidase